MVNPDEAVNPDGSVGSNGVAVMNEPVPDEPVPDEPVPDEAVPEPIIVVGRGRLGRALRSRLGEAGLRVELVPGREERRAGSLAHDALAGAGVVILAVPDAAISGVSAGIPAGPVVGHCSGALGPGAITGREESFGFHPLMTVTGPETVFAGGFAALSASGERAGRIARRLVDALGMRSFEIADADRAAYHAAASIASNAVTVIGGFAERLAATAGVPREALLPLARAALENWGRLGAEGALTGPVARGDWTTVARQRRAVEKRLPADAELFDALVRATVALAANGRVESGTIDGPGEESATA